VPSSTVLAKKRTTSLKGALIGGQSQVFKRYHATGLTDRPKPCKRIIGYDANALYLSTMLREMPCGKEKVVHYDHPEEAAGAFAPRLKAGAWFGFAEVDIEIPKSLWMKFEEMPPFFFTKHIPDEAVPPHMKD